MNVFDEDTVEISNSSKYSLNETVRSGVLSVVLKIHDLNEDTDAGTYWCRGFLMDGRMLIPTNSFQLKSSETYLDNECRLDQILRSAMSTCARVVVSDLTTTPVVSFTNVTSDTYTTFSAESSTTVSQFGFTTVSPGSSVPVTYVVIGLIGFLCAICIMLGFVICLLCRKVRHKSRLFMNATKL